MRHLIAISFFFFLGSQADATPACLVRLGELTKKAWSWYRVPEVRKFSVEEYQKALKKYREVDHPEDRDMPTNFEEKIAYMDALSEHLEHDFHLHGLDFSKVMVARTPIGTKPTATQKYIGRILRRLDFEKGVSEPELRMAIEDLSFLARGDPFRFREYIRRRSQTKKHFSQQTLAVSYEKKLLMDAMRLHGKIIPPTKWEMRREKYGWVRELLLTLFYNSDIVTTMFPLYFPRLGPSSRWISEDEAAAALTHMPEAKEAHLANVAKVSAKTERYGNYMVFRSFANKASLLVLTLVLTGISIHEMKEDASRQGQELVLQAHKVMADEGHKVKLEDIKALRLEIEEARKEHFYKKQIFIAASTLGLALFYLGSSKVMTWSAKHYLRIFMRLAIMASLLSGKEARIEASQADQLINSLRQIELQIEQEKSPDIAVPIDPTVR